MYFQHEGAPSHYTPHVMQHLNDTLPNRWIGHGSTNNWPPKSPDLTLLDFCLWGLMKSEVYRKKVDTQDKLLINILDVIACIKERQDALRRTTRHAFTRIAKCIDVDGGIFEHYKLFQLCHLNNKYHYQKQYIHTISLSYQQFCGCTFK